MRVRELLESDVESESKADRTVAEAIISECSVMLKAYRETGKFIYRGIRGKSQRFVHEKIRKDRIAVQMSSTNNLFLHELYLECGFEATRRNSIFCSVHPGFAGDWGEPYVIFVKDGWTGTILEQHRDDYSFYDVQTIATGAMAQYFNGRQRPDISDTDEALMKQIVANMKRVKPEAWETAVRQFKRLDPVSFSSSSDLVNVIDKKYVDIIITGSDYYAVRKDIAPDFCATYLGIK